MALQVYNWSERGKCGTCNKIIWTTAPDQAVVCSCNDSHIMQNQQFNTTPISDEEFKQALSEEINEAPQDILLNRLIE